MQPIIIRRLYELGMIKFGDFKLSSGKKSSFYINLRELPSYPDLFHDIMNIVLEKIREISFDVICGIATGGIPFASYLAFSLKKPLVYVRKSPKNHGLKDMIVGRVNKRRVLLIDDVATTGGSLIRAINILRASGANIDSTYVIVLRSDRAIDLLKTQSVNLLYLYHARDIFSVLKNIGLIDNSQYKVLLQEIDGI
ncbi:MAG: orotate phosphoribosyltransferase [Candidatus Njordarchaeota archaeon]